MKPAAAIIGLFVSGLAYLSYRGWIDVKWVAIEHTTTGTSTNAAVQAIHALHIPNKITIKHLR
jgi:hypothetical protein